MKRVLIALAVAAVLALGTAPDALAQGANVDQKRLETIRAHMEKGQSLFGAGSFKEAAQVFEAGYAEQPYSAFLFNAGVCYQKLDDYDKAIDKFNTYLSREPTAPDAEKVKARVKALEAAKQAAPSPGDAGAGDAGVEDASAPSAPLTPDTAQVMKSLAIIETEPVGAPVKLYAKGANARPFRLGTANSGWTEVVSTQSPANLTLEIGSYHVVVEPFQDFKACETDITVEHAKVFHFRANLSQGSFMAFLRVAANVQGAYVYLDDPEKKQPPWGTTPHGELVSNGAHALLVEAPGFEPLVRNIEVSHGEEREITVKLVRVEWGFLRVDGNAPELKVEVDEKAVGVWRAGEAPLQVKLDARAHRIRIKADGYKTYEETLTVPRGQILPLHANMIEKYPRGAAWVQAAAAAVLIGAGVYLGLRSNSLHDELEADRRAGVLEEDDSRIKEGRLFAIGADAGFVLGGLLAAFATYNFIRDPNPESRASRGKPVEFDDPKKGRPTARRAPSRVARHPRIQVGPTLLPNAAGLFIGGRF